MDDDLQALVSEAVEHSSVDHIKLDCLPAVLKHIKGKGVSVRCRSAVVLAYCSSLTYVVDKEMYTKYGLGVVLISQGRHTEEMRENQKFVADLVSTDHTEHFWYSYDIIAPVC